MLQIGPKLESVNVNLREYPQNITENQQTDYLYILGDLHGNALKALYFTLQLGLVSLPQQDFTRLIEIYDKANKDLTIKDVSDIKSIFHNLQKEKNGQICLIGDTLADRGWNDGFFLLLMKHFRRIGLPVEIPVSNHDCEFILRMEAKDLYTAITLAELHRVSLNNLNEIVHRKIFDEKEVSDLYSNDYLPSLKALAYALDGNDIMILSHAAIDINVIKLLADKWKIAYQDKTAEELAGTIDRINAYFQDMAKNKRLNTLIDKVMLNVLYQGLMLDLRRYNNPLEFMMWNRYYETQNIINRLESHNGYNIRYGHGHDDKDSTQQNIYNLDFDNGLGKTRDADKGKMSYVRARHANHPSNQLEGLQQDSVANATKLLRQLPVIDQNAKPSTEIVYDNIDLSLTPGFEEFLRGQCGSNSPSEFYSEQKGLKQ